MATYRLNQVAEYHGLGGYDNADITADMKSDGYGSTSAGVYTVHKIVPHRSYGRWANSAVPWNTETRITSRKTVQVKMGGRWTNLSTLPGWDKLKTQKNVYAELISSYDDLFDTGSVGKMKKVLKLDRKGILLKMKVPFIASSPVGHEIPSKWLLNDFGHMSIKFFRDKNHDGRVNKGEKLHDQFIHSSPNTEIWSSLDDSSRLWIYGSLYVTSKKLPDYSGRFTRALLAYSHGCIHAFPNDVDDMIKNGYIKKSGIVEIHPYDKVSTPTLIRDRHRTLLFEVHFFPKDAKIIAYQTLRLPKGIHGVGSH